MKKKVVLTLEQLRVETFATLPPMDRRRGTVLAHSDDSGDGGNCGTQGACTQGVGETCWNICVMSEGPDLCDSELTVCEHGAWC